MDVATGANFCEQLFAWRGVEIQNRQRRSAGLISTERHGGDVYAVTAEQRADASDNSGAIGVFENEHDTVRSRFHRPAVHADNSRRRAEERATNRNGFSFGGRG